MKEKIYAFLKTKMQGVPDAYLQRVAEQYSKTITDEAQIATVITDGVVDVLKDSAMFVQQEGDRRAQTAQRTALDEFRKKHGLDENGNKIQTPPPTPPVPPVIGGDAPEWVKTLIESQSKQISELKTLVSGVVTTQTASQKQAMARELLSKTKLPKELQEKWASRIDVNSETTIEEQVKVLEAEGLELQQYAINAAVERGEFTPNKPNSPAGTDAELVKLIEENGKTDQPKVGVMPLGI